VPVAGHAELVTATPAKGATVPQAPTLTVAITFSEALKSTSKADILGPDQSVVGTAKLDPKNNKRVTWTSTAPPAAGTWTVKWTSVATDGHVLRGQYTFAVSAAAPSVSATASVSASAAASASSTAAPTAAPSPTPVAANDSGTLLPIVAALIAIAILGLVLLRSRRSPSGR
jgi:methionine-rich copper-binding protein CopC